MHLSQVIFKANKLVAEGGKNSSFILEKEWHPENQMFLKESTVFLMMEVWIITHMDYISLNRVAPKIREGREGASENVFHVLLKPQVSENYFYD